MSGQSNHSLFFLSEISEAMVNSNASKLRLVQPNELPMEDSVDHHFFAKFINRFGTAMFDFFDLN